MGDYASKGVAGTGLGLGIAGTALALLNNNNGGILGGLFGGNANNATQDYISKLQSEVGRLEAEKYADGIGKQVYMQALTDNRDLRKEIKAFTDPLTDSLVKAQQEIATLKAEQKCCCEKQELREQIVIGKINEVALTTNGRFNVLDQTLDCMQQGINRNTYRLNQITEEHIPLSKVCPEPMPRYNSWEMPMAGTKASK